MERAENVSRFIDVNSQMMLDLPSGSISNGDRLSAFPAMIRFRFAIRDCHTGKTS